jgi:hypothetical protein
MLKIERHDWQPSFKNEIWITDKNRDHGFTITLKQDADIEIEFDWDYGYGGRGTERMFISIELLTQLIKDISQT